MYIYMCIHIHCVRSPNYVLLLVSSSHGPDAPGCREPPVLPAQRDGELGEVPRRSVESERQVLEPGMGFVVPNPPGHHLISTIRNRLSIECCSIQAREQLH